MAKKISGIGVVPVDRRSKRTDSRHQRGNSRALVRRSFTPEDRKRIFWEKEATYREIFLPKLQLVKGLPTFLEEVYASDLSMGIGTAAPLENVDFVLDNLNLRHYFKSVVHAGMVTKGKPDPEVLERVADNMGIALDHCVVFEDSVTGAETARLAGCPTFIITTTHAPIELVRFPNVIGFYNDFTNITLENTFDTKKL